MGKHDRDWTAYHRGREAYQKGVAYHHNPYKIPKLHLSWSLGWTDAKNKAKRK